LLRVDRAIAVPVALALPPAALLHIIPPCMLLVGLAALMAARVVTWPSLRLAVGPVAPAA